MTSTTFQLVSSAQYLTAKTQNIKKFLLAMFSVLCLSILGYGQTNCNLQTSLVNYVEPDCGQSNGSITINVSSVINNTPTYTGPYTAEIINSNGQQTQSNITGNTITFTGLAKDAYCIMVTDKNGCMTMRDQLLLCKQEPQCNISTNYTETDATSCNTATGSITLAVSTNTALPFVATWFDQNGNMYGPFTYNSYTTTLNGLASGSYLVILKDANGCPASRENMIVKCNNFTATVKAGTLTCANGTTLLTVTATGGTFPYQYSINGSSFQSNNIFSVSAGTYTVSVRDANGVVLQLAPVTVSNAGLPNCNTVCTYTQGYYGNKGGVSSDGLGNSYTTLQLITKSINNWGGTLVIGEPGHSVYITAADAQAVIDYLPGGGPSTTLPAGDVELGSSAYISLYGSGRISNVLLAQTITLGLNLEIGNGILANVPLNGLVSNTIINALTNKTVGGLFTLANQALAGYPLPTGVTLDNIEAAIDSINQYFDECRVFNGQFTMNNITLSMTQLSKTSIKVTPNEVKSLSVIATPNPFRSNIKFTIQSNVSGQGELMLYNTLGVKIATPFSGYISAGRSQTVEYKVPSSQSGGLFYILKVGNRTTSGKLLSAQ